jgi:cytochrome c-type biogenesis protein
MEPGNINYITAFGFGLASFISPCVIPLIPSYITYITGLSFADLQAEHPSREVRKQTILHSLIFIAGFTTVYTLLGASATFVGGVVFAGQEILRKIGGILMILFGIHLSGVLPLRFLLGEKRINLRRKPAGYIGTFVVGVAFAAGWTPCTGPILGSILSMAATEATVQKGTQLLFVYSMGLGVPFLLASVALHEFLVLFNRYKKYIRLTEILTAIFLIVIGILLFSGYLSVITGYVNRWFALFG